MDLFKFIYSLGTWVRNKKIFSCYEMLKESEHWNTEKIKEYQLVKLTELIRNAYQNSSYYKDKFDRAGFKLADLKTLEDLQFVPITSKEELLENSKAIQIHNCGEKLYSSETSGSTGRPLVFFRNQEWDAWHNASVFRGYSWHNVQPWERNGYLWGYNIAPSKRIKVKFLDLLQNRFRLFSYKDEDVSNFVKKLEHAKYLGGYSSMVYEVAKKINAQNLNANFNLKMIKGTSEKIYDAYKEEVEKAFGRKIISEYGSAEGGIIAFECAHDNMHINMETVIIEVVDNEIVVTNLVSKSFPIIRYKLGDYIRVDYETKCACGMVHPIVKEVTGRVGAVIYGKKSTYPSLTLYYVFKNLALVNRIVLNYQVVQDEIGSIFTYIESSLDEYTKEKLLQEFYKYFSDDLDVIIVDKHKRSDHSAKKKDFISNVIDARPYE
jgi:phenylacetate-CoA ligase